MNFEVALIVYGAIILLTRFVSGDTSNPPWQVAITVALGIAWALQPTPPAGQKVVVRPTSIVASVLLVAMGFAASELFVLLPSAFFDTYGLGGLLTGRITLAGRVGPGREYTGAAAYLHSLLSVVFGAAGVVFAIFPEVIRHP